ncbi:serine protease inhibitor 42Dd-like [Tribolium madens]|uniref:serine protease inhibitor 42Dd-like n=1 Tax=Tribolium madens TaxID=41895 RepID=UPI001CF7578A|nr:serine protease inhibitor 42Dd-like [Tribolium madens]
MKELLRYIPDENFGYSPIALETLLGLARAGSLEETAQEIKTALSFPLNPKEIESVIKEIYPLLKSAKSFHFLAANRIYLQNQYSIKKDFKTVSETAYNIQIEHYDSKRGRQSVNEWVKNATEGKIQSVLEDTDVEAAAKCILISAVYFKLNFWKFAQKEGISRRVFTSKTQKPLEIEFMEKTGLYNYFESPELKATYLEIPIENSFDLVMILPNGKNGLSALETKINDVFVEPKFSQTRVTVAVPKLSFEFKHDLKKVFQHLGMSRAFTTDANMNGFLAEAKVLYISHVIHKSLFYFTDDSTEQGIKATAANKRVGSTSKTFIADHPFIFYVKSKNVIVYAGRVTHPT